MRPGTPLELEDNFFVNREFIKIIYVFRHVHNIIPPSITAVFVSQGLQSGKIFYNGKVINQDIFVILKTMGWIPGSHMIVCHVATEGNCITQVGIAAPIATSSSSTHAYICVF